MPTIFLAFYLVEKSIAKQRTLIIQIKQQQIHSLLSWGSSQGMERNVHFHPSKYKVSFLLRATKSREQVG